MVKHKIEEIKIDGITYVPSDMYSCLNCALHIPDCQILKRYNDLCFCNLFEGKSLKIKE